MIDRLNNPNRKMKISLFSKTAIVFVLLGSVSMVAADGEMKDILHPPRLGDGWKVGDVGSAGFDRDKIIDLAKALNDEEYSNVHSVLIGQAGKLVFEQYLSGIDESWGTRLGRVDFDAETLHDLRSISKSVTSILLGIALGSDFDKALKRSIFHYYPDKKPKSNPEAHVVTLGHVLKMTAGFDWNEMTVSYSQSHNDEIRLYSTNDPIGFVLQRRLREKPGERWYYNGGLSMVVAGVVQDITGRPLVEYAKEVLFKPLGISRFKWLGSPSWESIGLPSAASGLRLLPRDLAKIGSLMANGGRWQGKQVVPEKWVMLSGQRHREDLSPWDADGTYGYGLQWWHGNFSVEGEIFSAITGVGNGGQRVFVIPSKQLWVTVLAGNYNSRRPDLWWQSERIFKRILAAHGK